jgi:hypothetical protein
VPVLPLTFFYTVCTYDLSLARSRTPRNPIIADARRRRRSPVAMETPVEDPPSPPHLHQPPSAVHPPTSPWPIRPRAGDALDVLTAGVQGQEASPVADIQRLAGPNAAPGNLSNAQRLAAALGHLAAPVTDVSAWTPARAPGCRSGRRHPAPGRRARAPGRPGRRRPPRSRRPWCTGHPGRRPLCTCRPDRRPLCHGRAIPGCAGRGGRWR